MRASLFRTLLLAGLCAAPPVSFASSQTIDMAGYSVSLPGSWWSREDKSLDQVWACNKTSGQCTGTGGGFPLPGAVFVSIMPAEYVPGGRRLKSVEDIVSSEPHAGLPAPSISHIDIGEGKMCAVARLLLFGKVWDEVYGLRVQGHLFRIWVQYGNEPGREAGYRRAVVAILSSIAVPGE